MTMIFNLKDESVNQLSQDIDKKYLKSGYRLGGSVSDDKVNLYLIDDYGKHSGFMNEYFYGKITKNTLSGKFRISNYALALLIILFAVAVESIVAAIIFANFDGVITPAVIITIEILYMFYLKHISKDNNMLIRDYLSSLTNGEQNDD